MSHGPESGGSQEIKTGKKGITRKEFLETSPLYLFGAMLFGVFNKKGISDFLSQASKTLEFFSGPFMAGSHGATKASSAKH
ncbi:MAG: hypothetical protein HYZ51_03745 [Candidatus Doudnabacteria bacterium]|nr:hypothetical protein [Candidatus Doudnabacteria bacterium]